MLRTPVRPRRNGIDGVLGGFRFVGPSAELGMPASAGRIASTAFSALFCLTACRIGRNYLETDLKSRYYKVLVFEGVIHERTGAISINLL